MSPTAIAVGLSAETRSHLEPRLSSHGLEVEWVHRAEEALALAGRQRYDLVTCSYPLPDMILRRFGQAVRRSGGASRDAAVLVLALPDMLSEARLGLPRGRSLVRSRLAPGGRLAEDIGHLLRLAPRRDADDAMHLRLQCAHGEADEVTLANLSVSGMLVRTGQRPPLKSRCSFELDLGDRAAVVSGVAEVVRHAARPREVVPAFALRFVELDGDGAHRLRSFLAAG